MSFYWELVIEGAVIVLAAATNGVKSAGRHNASAPLAKLILSMAAPWAGRTILRRLRSK